VSHIDIIKGDYIFYAWKEGESERFDNTIKKLELSGFTLKEVERDFQNLYRYYEDTEGNEVIITECFL